MTPSSPTSRSEARWAQRCASTSTVARWWTSGAEWPIPTSGRPWAEDTIVTVFSSTKGVTAIGANLAIERGLLDPDATVATYWPEFAAAGKEAITVRQVLSHQAGLPLVEDDLSLEDALAWDPVVAALGRPGAALGAGHAARVPHAHLRMAGGRAAPPRRPAAPPAPSCARRSPDRSRSTSGSDCPKTLEPRVATLVPPDHSLKEALAPFGDSMLLARVFSNPGGHFDYDDMWNTRRLRACELPSSNGIGDARGARPALRRAASATASTVDRVLAARHGRGGDRRAGARP